MLRFKIVFIFIISTTIIFAQDYKKLTKAFAESYVKESAEKYTEAISVLNACYDDNSYEINLRLGWLYYKYGKFSTSVNYYKKAINLMPYSIEPRLGIILPLSSSENWNEVVNQYNKILSIDSNNTTALYNLGVIYYERKDYRQAYTHLEKVVNLYPWDYDSVLMLAWTNYMMGKTREAKILFQKVLLYSPDDCSAKEGIALIK